MPRGGIGQESNKDDGSSTITSYIKMWVSLLLTIAITFEAWHPRVRGGLAEILSNNPLKSTVPQSESHFSFYAQLKVTSQTISGTLGQFLLRA